MAFVIEREFVSNGMKCVVTFTDGAIRCGYVQAPDIFAKGDLDKFDVHGGVTWVGKDHPKQADAKNVWVGFDCGGYFDARDVQQAIDYKLVQPYSDYAKYLEGIGSFNKGNQRVVRTTAFVAEECKLLAFQISKAAFEQSNTKDGE